MMLEYDYIVRFKVDKLKVNTREASGVTIYHGIREYVISKVVIGSAREYPEAEVYYGDGAAYVIFKDNDDVLAVLHFPRDSVILQEFKEVS